MRKKLDKSFYQQSALDAAKQFLGKYLVFNSPKGRVSGRIVEVEAYPAFYDEIYHGNKRTKRTEVLYNEGGFVYVYLIYGMYYQFEAVMNKRDVPDAVFIRALVPDEGLDIMNENLGRSVKNVNDYTKGPGLLCKSFGINKSHYGVDLTSDTIFIEDRGIVVKDEEIIADKRVGINSRQKGWDYPLRFMIK